jgi:hypothetical protein
LALKEDRQATFVTLPVGRERLSSALPQHRLFRLRPSQAIVCDDNGLAVFDLIRGHVTNARAILCAFDLLELNGEDIRREPIEDRKRRLAGLLRLPHEGIALNEHFS